MVSAQNACREAILKIEDYSTLILDLKNVTGIDSMTLGYFIELHNEFKQTGKTLIFSNLADTVKMAFKITRFDKILHIK